MYGSLHAFVLLYTCSTMSGASLWSFSSSASGTEWRPVVLGSKLEQKLEENVKTLYPHLKVFIPTEVLSSTGRMHNVPKGYTLESINTTYAGLMTFKNWTTGESLFFRRNGAPRMSLTPDFISCRSCSTVLPERADPLN